MSSELFDYVLVVTLPPNATTAQITYRFPPSDGGKKKDTISSSIAQFCFPENGEHKKTNSCETFSFVLTEGDGSKRFAYCRRFITNTTSECYCIISYVPSFNLFSQVLDVVEERRAQSSSAVFLFLKSVLANKFPAPGESIEVSTLSTTGDKPDIYKLTRPSGNDYLLDYVSFSTLFSLLSIPNIVHLLGSLMIERRVIISSPNLQDLSAVVNALVAAINPFTWQHVFIPVLPNTLLDYCSAPMPFFVGILSSSLPLLNNIPMEEVLIVDLSKGTFVKNPDPNGIFPPKLANSLQKRLSAKIQSNLKGRALDVAIAHTFLSFLMKLCGSYHKFVKKNQFDAQAFIDAQSKDKQQFLKRFQESQLWEAFLREREAMLLNGTLHNCIFVKEATNPELDLTESELFCWRCAETLSSDIVVKRGSIYCRKCVANGSFLKNEETQDEKRREKIKKKLEAMRQKLKKKKRSKESLIKEEDDSGPPSRGSSGIFSLEEDTKKRSNDKKNLASAVASFFSGDKERDRDKDSRESDSPGNSGIYSITPPSTGASPGLKELTKLSFENLKKPEPPRDRSLSTREDSIRDRRDNPTTPRALVRSVSAGRIATSPARTSTTTTPRREAPPPSGSFVTKKPESSGSKTPRNPFAKISSLMNVNKEKEKEKKEEKERQKELEKQKEQEEARRFQSWAEEALYTKPTSPKPPERKPSPPKETKPRPTSKKPELAKSKSLVGFSRFSSSPSTTPPRKAAPVVTSGLVAKNSKIFEAL